MARADDHFFDDEAGPVVRPYALVRGRTKPPGETLDIITMAYALQHAASNTEGLEPEHLEVLAECRFPASVADLASSLDLPVGVIRILLADLRDLGLVTIHTPRMDQLSDVRILKEVADGLRRL